MMVVILMMMLLIICCCNSGGCWTMCSDGWHLLSCCSVDLGFVLFDSVKLKHLFTTHCRVFTMCTPPLLCHDRNPTTPCVDNMIKRRSALMSERWRRGWAIMHGCIVSMVSSRPISTLLYGCWALWWTFCLYAIEGDVQINSFMFHTQNVFQEILFLESYLW